MVIGARDAERGQRAARTWAWSGWPSASRWHLGPTAHNGAVMATLLLVHGVVLTGKGEGGLL